MSGSLIHDASMVTSGVSITTGLMAWFGNNATAIGAIVALGSFILTAIFLVLNYRLNLKVAKLKLKELEK